MGPAFDSRLVQYLIPPYIFLFAAYMSFVSPFLTYVSAVVLAYAMVLAGANS